MVQALLTFSILRHPSSQPRAISTVHAVCAVNVAPTLMRLFLWMALYAYIPCGPPLPLSIHKPDSFTFIRTSALSMTGWAAQFYEK